MSDRSWSSDTGGPIGCGRLAVEAVLGCGKDIVSKDSGSTVDESKTGIFNKMLLLGDSTCCDCFFQQETEVGVVDVTLQLHYESRAPSSRVR